MGQDAGESPIEIAIGVSPSKPPAVLGGPRSASHWTKGNGHYQDLKRETMEMARARLRMNTSTQVRTVLAWASEGEKSGGGKE